MKFSIVVSKKDLAGINFKKLFVENFGFRETEKEFDSNKIFEFKNLGKNFELITINESQVFADYLNRLETDFFVFASKHASKKPKPMLTVHAPGNLEKAELGGKDFQVCKTSTFLSRNYLLALKEKKEEKKLEEFLVSLEATHHGPFLEKPALFIELGSTEKEWQMQKPAEAIAETILECTSLEAREAVPCIGIGGTHYCEVFNKKVFQENLSFGHIAAEYSLPFLNSELLQKMVLGTIEKVKLIVVYKNGLGKAEQKNKVKELLAQQEIEVKFI